MYPTLYLHLHQECPCNLCCHQSKEEVRYFPFTEPKRIWQYWVDEHCINHCQHPMCDVGHNKKDNNLKMSRFYLFRNGVVNIIVNIHAGIVVLRECNRKPGVAFHFHHCTVLKEHACDFQKQEFCMYGTHPIAVHPRCMSPLSEKQQFIGLEMVTS